MTKKYRSYECAHRLAKCMQCSPYCHHSPGKKNPFPFHQQWKKRSASLWKTSSSAPRATPTQDAPDQLAAWGSNLPLASRLFGLAREELCSPPGVSLWPLWIHETSQPLPSSGLGCLPSCPAEWALSAADSHPSCCQTKLLFIRNHCLRDLRNHSTAFSESIWKAEILQACLLPGQQPAAPGSWPG